MENNGGLKKITILLVDDHAILRQGIRELLNKEEDMQVVGEAENGREGVQQARKFQPDVVIMDVEMPHLYGTEATRQIKKNAPETRVIILSEHDDDIYAELAVEHGAHSYLLKHCNKTELVKAIREAMKGNAFFSATIAKRLRANCRAAFASGEPYRPRSVLTEREAEVLQFIAESRSNQQIANELCLSIKTVEKHRQQLMDKLNIHDVAGLTRYFYRRLVLAANGVGKMHIVD